MQPKQLAQIPLFKRLPEAELEKLAASMEEITQPAGTLLFSEGDQGDYFYVISEGELEVIKALGTNEERLIGVRTTDNFIGELSLINPEGIRMASVRSKTDSCLWRLSRQDFEQVLEENALVANLIMRELSNRLTTAHENTITDLQQKNIELTIAYQDLKDAQEQIIEKERMEHELQLAYQIQKSILPSQIPETDEFFLGAFLRPAREVGGDFYDFFPLPDGKLGVLIGDVTDKGIPSALVMAQTHALIYSEAISGAAPEAVFKEVNTKMMRLNQSGLFVTAIYGILELTKRKFVFARAGHEIPLLLESNREIRLAPKGTGQPLGLLDDPIFDLQAITLPAGSRLLLYTDGALDMHNENNVQFGMSSLQQEFILTGKHSPQDACELIYQKLANYQGSTAQDDDITMVMLHSAD